MRALVAAAVLALTGCGADSRPAAEPGSAADVRALAAHLQAAHPNLHHSVSRARFRQRATTSHVAHRSSTRTSCSSS